jgi:hypothetical protein
VSEHEIADIDDCPDFNAKLAEWLTQKAGDGWELAGLAQFIVPSRIVQGMPGVRWKVILKRSALAPVYEP